MLTLRERVAVLKSINSGKSGHSVAQEFNVGKTHIQGIVRDREEIVRKLEAGECSRKKYTKIRKTDIMRNWIKLSGNSSPGLELRISQ